jgi:hypothetical protein
MLHACMVRAFPFPPIFRRASSRPHITPFIDQHTSHHTIDHPDPGQAPISGPLDGLAPPLPGPPSARHHCII